MSKLNQLMLVGFVLVIKILSFIGHSNVVLSLGLNDTSSVRAISVNRIVVKNVLIKQSNKTISKLQEEDETDDNDDYEDNEGIDGEGADQEEGI